MPDQRNADQTLLELSTPTMVDGLSTEVDPRLPVIQALTTALAGAASDAETERIRKALKLEMRGKQYEVLALREDGQLDRVEADTPISDVTVTIQKRFPDGSIGTVKSARLQVKQYTDVGRVASLN